MSKQKCIQDKYFFNDKLTFSKFIEDRISILEKTSKEEYFDKFIQLPELKGPWVSILCKSRNVDFRLTFGASRDCKEIIMFDALYEEK